MTGRGRYGTGLAGSETYSSNAAAAADVLEGTHVVAFQALNPGGGDSTAFIDEVHVVLPEQSNTPSTWTIVDLATAKSASGAKLSRQPDGSYLASGPNVAHEKYEVTFTTPLVGINAVRLEVLLDPSLPYQGPGRAENGNFILSQFDVAASARGNADFRPIVLAKALADFEQVDRPVASAIDGVGSNGWGIMPHRGKPHVAVFELKEPLGHANGTTLRFHLGHSGLRAIGRFRLAVTNMTPPIALPEPVHPD